MTKNNVLTSIEALQSLFSLSPALADEEYDKAFLGEQSFLKAFSRYALNFSPYQELAETCGMESFSLMQSNVTHRLYIWNVNLGGHYPRLEMRPVKYEHVVDLKRMAYFHQNWAERMSENLQPKPGYQV